MRLQPKIIHIQWQGPLQLPEIKSMKDDSKDYGVYQIYGAHRVYGTNILLYIGKANQQTFAKRIGQERWDVWEYNEGKVEIRLGRLVGEQTPSDKQWENQIDLAEVLLINAHKPAQNASNIGELSQLRDKDLRNVHVLNWGDLGALLPEVSGDRWTDKWVSDKFDVYGAHE